MIRLSHGHVYGADGLTCGVRPVYRKTQFFLHLLPVRQFFFLRSYFPHEVYFRIDIHRIISIGYPVFTCIPCFTWNAAVSGRNQVYSKSRSTLEQS